VAITLCGPAFQQVHLASGLVTLLTRSYNPAVQARRFGLFRFRSPLLSESQLIYFPPGTEMVHFPGLARTRLWIQRAVPEFHSGGFPHSDIPGSKPACDSPRLFAACHVLHRLLAPRHPPYALSSLTIKLTQHVACTVRLDRNRNARQCACEQARLSTRATRAELAVYSVRIVADSSGVIAFFLQLSKNLRSTPGGAPADADKNKKPGIKRRASPSKPSGTDSLEARPVSIRYS
jgi:hypothetical protein